MLDERFRQNVERLATRDSTAWDEPELDESARERILERVAIEGPATIRRTRRARMVAFAAGPLLACAAAFALYVTHRQAPSPVAAQHLPATERVDSRACESRARPVGASKGFVLSGDRLQLDLQPVAAAAATGNASVKLERAERCETVIALAEGSVVVHARDLGGGTLTVRAGNTDVIVHGTLFGVTRTADSATVEVVEGRVVVRRQGQEYTVSAGQRLTASSIGVATGRLEDSTAQGLREQLSLPKIVGLESLPPAAPEGSPREGASAAAAEPSRERAVPDTPASSGGVVEKAPSSADILERAEAARREGRHADARSLYRQAGAGSGPTAEAAWLGLARMELALGNLSGARQATEERRRRFGNGTLGPEAMWIDVRIDRQAGDIAGAQRRAEQIVRTWPTSPQAAAATRWLAELRGD